MLVGVVSLKKASHWHPVRCQSPAFRNYLQLMFLYVDTGWWFGTFFYFRIYWVLIIPIDLYFSEGFKPPTRILMERGPPVKPCKFNGKCRTLSWRMFIPKCRYLRQATSIRKLHNLAIMTLDHIPRS